MCFYIQIRSLWRLFYLVVGLLLNKNNFWIQLVSLSRVVWPIVLERMKIFTSLRLLCLIVPLLVTCYILLTDFLCLGCNLEEARLLLAELTVTIRCVLNTFSVDQVVRIIGKFHLSVRYHEAHFNFFVWRLGRVTKILSTVLYRLWHINLWKVVDVVQEALIDLD